MLAYLTFSYFLFLFLWIYKKHGLDISAVIVGVYMISALCSALLISGMGSEEYAKKVPSLFPTVIYCAMTTLTVYPFYEFNSNKKRELKMMNQRLFSIMAWTYIIAFFSSLILFREDLIFRLALGAEIGELRGAALANAQGSLSGLSRLLFNFFGVILSLSPVAFLLFLYSLSFLQKSWWFNVLLFMSSMGCIVQGIMGIDRSMTAYWLIDLVFIYVLMRPYLKKKSRRIVFFLGIVAATLAFSYIILMTFSRFGDNSETSVLNYIGQSYLNFCWFWDNYTRPLTNWGFFFPISNRFLGLDFGAPVAPVEFGEFIELKVGYFVNVFYSFMGTVILYLGQWAVIPYCVGFFFASKFLLGKRVKGFHSFIRVFVVAVVPYCGFISYVFVDYIMAMAAIFLLVLCYFLDKNIKFSNEKNSRSNLSL